MNLPGAQESEPNPPRDGQHLPAGTSGSWGLAMITWGAFIAIVVFVAFGVGGVLLTYSSTWPWQVVGGSLLVGCVLLGRFYVRVVRWPFRRKGK